MTSYEAGVSTEYWSSMRTGMTRYETVKWLAVGEWPSSMGIMVQGIPTLPTFIEGQ